MAITTLAPKHRITNKIYETMYSGRHQDRQYRIPPPEGSVRPFPSPEEMALEASIPILNTSTLSRRDDRYPEQLRPISKSLYFNYRNAHRYCQRRTRISVL